MKRHLMILMGLAMVSAACGPSGSAPTAGPAQPTAAPDPTSTQLPVDLHPAHRAALQTLAAALGVPLESITLVSLEAVDWPNSCLGVELPGLMCAQVITPGFRVVLASGGRRFEFHSNSDGTAVWPATIALRWSRSGGFAGFCDEMTVFLTGEVYTSNCRGNGTSGRLTAAERVQLDEWLMEFGAVEIVQGDRAVADAMGLTLTLTGFGSGQPTAEDQAALLNWAQAVYGRAAGGQ